MIHKLVLISLFEDISLEPEPIIKKEKRSANLNARLINLCDGDYNLFVLISWILGEYKNAKLYVSPRGRKDVERSVLCSSDDIRNALSVSWGDRKIRSYLKWLEDKDLISKTRGQREGVTVLKIFPNISKIEDGCHA